MKSVVPSNGRPRRSRRRATGVAAAALCAALLAGCGGSSDSAETKPTPDSTTAPVTAPALPADMAQRPACGFLTQAEVETAVGAKVNPGKEKVEQARSLCTFTLAANADQTVGVVAVTSSGVPAFFKTAKERMTAPQTVGAGDEAFVSGGQALVRRGNTMVAIIVALRRELSQLATVSTKLAQSVGSHI